MKKLIKADLTGILELVPVYQPVEYGRIEQAIDDLECGKAEDYLFLARRGLCRLSTMTAAYDRDNFANSDWLAFRGMHRGHEKGWADAPAHPGRTAQNEIRS